MSAYCFWQKNQERVTYRKTQLDQRQQQLQAMKEEQALREQQRQQQLQKLAATVTVNAPRYAHKTICVVSILLLLLLLKTGDDVIVVI